MKPKNIQPVNELRVTAHKMIRCMGVKEALACCMNNQWAGLSEEIQTLTKDHLFCNDRPTRH